MRLHDKLARFVCKFLFRSSLLRNQLREWVRTGCSRSVLNLIFPCSWKWTNRLFLTPQRTTPVSFSVIFDLIDSLIASFLLFFNQLQNITTTVDCRQPPRIDQSLTHFKTNCTYESKITRLHIFSYLVTIQASNLTALAVMTKVTTWD